MFRHKRSPDDGIYVETYVGIHTVLIQTAIILRIGWCSLVQAANCLTAKQRVIAVYVGATCRYLQHYFIVILPDSINYIEYGDSSIFHSSL